MDSVRDVALLAVIVVISGTALVRPFTGFLGFLVFSIVNPQSMAWSISSAINPHQPIAGATILGYMISSEPKRLPVRLEVYLLVALWAVFGISTLTAVYPALAVAHLTQVSKILLMVLLSLPMVTTKERLLTLIRAIALSLGFLGLKAGLFAISTGGQFMVWGPENSFLEANNTIGVALAMNLPLLFYMRRIESRPWLRHLMAAMLLLSYPAIVCTFSRGAWLSAAAATALMIARSRHRWMIAVGLFLVVPMLSMEMLPERVANRYEDLENYQDDSSAQSRFWTWEYCRRVGFANPLTGAGFDFVSEATFRQYYPEFLAWRGKVSSCHSTWLTVFAEHGVPGFLLWVTLLGTTLASTWRVRQAARRAGPDWAWAVVVADLLQAAFVAYMVGGTFVEINYFDIYYQLVAVGVMLQTLGPQLIPREAPSGLDPQGPIDRGTVGRRPKE
jgi:probable O-glycosylation ligase (exosortase A-associated)